MGEGPIIKITRIRARRMILIYNEMIYMEMMKEYEGLMRLYIKKVNGVGNLLDVIYENIYTPVLATRLILIF